MEAPNEGRAMTDTTKLNGNRDRLFDCEAALDRNDRPHWWGHLEAAHKEKRQDPRACL